MHDQANRPTGPDRRRYPGLDAWRGAAALSVLVWHRYWNERAFASGLWVGVQLFFVISGYCIAAAVDAPAARRIGFPGFMRRRVRRIAPPYLASLLVWFGLRVLSQWGLPPSAALLSRASRASLAVPLLPLLQNVTMTPWLTLLARFIEGDPVTTPWHNPALFVGVHWSLNYEEQFYLLAGLFLLFSPRMRSPGWLVAVPTGLALAYQLAVPGRTSGVFVDYWLQFACGILVYVRLTRAHEVVVRRTMDLGLVLAILGCLAVSIAFRQLPLENEVIHPWPLQAVCLLCAGLLILARPISESPIWLTIMTPLRAVGRFSYSLYLIHQMLVDRTLQSARALGAIIGAPAADLLQLGGILLVAWLFYRVFEKPFLNASLPPAAPSTAAPTASVQSA
jgi:peptidoglycan/LPS O-acetylase OafA/YrhL